MGALTVWALAKRLWPVAAVLAALLALWAWGNSRYHAGGLAERATWQALNAKATADALALSIERQTYKDRAEHDAAERDRLYQIARTPITNEVTRYVASPGAALPCPDAAGVRLGAASIGAANAALASAAH